ARGSVQIQRPRAAATRRTCGRHDIHFASSSFLLSRKLRYRVGVRARTYLDTSVISYVTNWPSRDIVTLAHQQITRDWLQRHRANFDLHVSELVLYETGRGDQTLRTHVLS